MLCFNLDFASSVIAYVKTQSMKRNLLTLGLTLALLACHNDDAPPTEPDPQPVCEIYTIPVVVHILHEGEAIVEGTNLSKARVLDQLKTLNDDYRRRPGSRGYNEHPDGADSGIEFMLAKMAPDGSATDGIVRINQNEHENDYVDSYFNYLAAYSYWNPEQYLNIWVVPNRDDYVDTFLGLATGPETDLPGGHLLTVGEPVQAEGVIIGHHHFGSSSINSKYNLGRTLTHEIGHYLGLLHPWGNKNCEENDFCNDTPAVDSYVTGATTYIGCAGEEVMISNYMNWSDDAVMNVFTNDQVARMRYVLENSPRRKSLLSSPGLLTVDH